MKLRRKLLIILCPVSIVSLVGLGFSTWEINNSINLNTNLNVGSIEENTIALDSIGIIVDESIFSQLLFYKESDVSSGLQNYLMLSNCCTFKVTLNTSEFSNSFLSLNYDDENYFALKMEFNFDENSIFTNINNTSSASLSNNNCYYFNLYSSSQNSINSNKIFYAPLKSKLFHSLYELYRCDSFTKGGNSNCVILINLFFDTINNIANQNPNVGIKFSIVGIDEFSQEI